AVLQERRRLVTVARARHRLQFTRMTAETSRLNRPGEIEVIVLLVAGGKFPLSQPAVPGDWSLIEEPVHAKQVTMSGKSGADEILQAAASVHTCQIETEKGAITLWVHFVPHARRRVREVAWFFDPHNNATAAS